jgi:hypothetical protein
MLAACNPPWARALVPGQRFGQSMPAADTSLPSPPRGGARPRFLPQCGSAVVAMSPRTTSLGGVVRASAAEPASSASALSSHV